MTARTHGFIAYLRVDNKPVSPAEVASTRHSRAKGLLGRDYLEGVLILPKVRSIHTFGMKFPIDVALMDQSMTVQKVFESVAPNRVVLPRSRTRHVVESVGGRFEEFGLRPGAQLVVALESVDLISGR